MNYDEFMEAELKRIKNYFGEDQIKMQEYWDMLEKEYEYIRPTESIMKYKVIRDVLNLRLTEDFKERVSEDINP
jgi:succinylglutamate desuccinylase